jgi:hypothetical protein
VRRKIEVFVGRLLTPGVRLILVKDVLSSIPVQILAACSLPKGVMTTRNSF